MTVLTDKTISNMSNKVNTAAVTQDVAFADSVATSHSNVSYCGTRTYTLSPTHSFLTISGTTMSLVTSNVADVRIYFVDLTVSLSSYPLVASITKTIVVTITCEVQTLTISTPPPASTTVTVGITAQPISLNFAATQTPACGNTVTFTLNSPPTFMSLKNLSALGGQIQVNGATASNANTYPKVLTATVDTTTT